ncbi:MAG: hypothetical protein CSA94_01175, partial [Bacteroidetes bacterium]
MVLGQLIDDFSDGDFSAQPTWLGDVEKYKVNDDYQLQLFDNQAGESVLYTTQEKLSKTEWKFWVRLKFSPSANNQARIYLAADGNDVASIENGVFVQLGESGSNDAVTLYKVVNGIESEICRGTEGLINSSFSLHLKICVSAENIWQVFLDSTGNGIYQLEAQGEAALNFPSRYFLIYNKYTVSNSSKFYFDDVEVVDFNEDNIAPLIDSVEVLNEKQLMVQFSEIVSQTTAETINNYTVLPNRHPQQAQRVDAMPNQVLLTFEAHFENQVEHTLAVKNVTDMYENVMVPDSVTFVYQQPFTPDLYDVVIHEVMVDVNPEPQGLPAYDYVELFNRTDKLLDLSGCKLKWGTQEKVFPENTYIQPHDFLLVAHQSAQYEQAENIVSFSELSLNNEALL